MIFLQMNVKNESAEILSFLNLEEHANALVRTFSGGMIRKLEVGQAMLHRPKVLFLDEPTTGLDPIADKMFGAIFLNYATNREQQYFFQLIIWKKPTASATRLQL